MMYALLAAVIGTFFYGASTAYAGALEGSVTIDGRPAVDAVVYLEPSGGALRAASPTPTVMDQKNLAFVPGVLPVVRGSRVEFTNSDDVEHNVFSPSVAARKFNLGTYGPGATRTVTFDEAGDVLVLCNIHMEMQAHILVLDAPYFSTVAHDSRYRITSVPAGTYHVKVWRERWLPFTQTVELPATGTLTVNITAGK